MASSRPLSETKADADGRTRWLLLQLYCVLKTAGAIEAWSERIGREFPRGQQAPDCEVRLQHFKDNFDTRLSQFESHLAQIVPKP